MHNEEHERRAYRVCAKPVVVLVLVGLVESLLLESLRGLADIDGGQVLISYCKHVAATLFRKVGRVRTVRPKIIERQSSPPGTFFKLKLKWTMDNEGAQKTSPCLCAGVLRDAKLSNIRISLSSYAAPIARRDF